MLRRLQAAEERRGLRAGPALRPHRAVRALRPRALGQAGVPVPALPDPAGLARRAAPGAAATASSPRPTSTSSARASSPFHHDVEVMRVMVEALGALPLPPRVVPVQQPQADPGLLPRARHRRRHGGDPDHRQARQAAARDGRRAARRRRPAPRPSRPSSAWPWPASGSPDTSFVEQVRALGVEDELLETGLTELAAVIEGCLPATSEQVAVEANLRIARGLDYYTGTVVEIFMSGYEHLKSVGGGGRYDALADDGKNVYPGVGVSFGVSRTIVPLLADGVLEASRAGAQRGARRRQRRGVAARPATTIAAALRARGIPTEVAASAAEVRQADPLRRAPRHPVRVVRRAPTAAHEVKDIRIGRAGVGRPRHLDPARGQTCDRRSPPRSSSDPHP